MFVPNIFSFASDGRAYRYGSIRMPLTIWGPWRLDAQINRMAIARSAELHESALPRPTPRSKGTLADVRKTVESMLRPEVVLDILQNFTVFATDKKHRRIKIICRYQQYEGTNLIVQRVVEGQIKKGLIWHFQGSGKSLLMVFTAQKLRMHPELGNPTVLIVVDRIDLDTQITATFNAADVPNMIKAESRDELQTTAGQGRSQGHHHDDPQVRRGRWRTQCPQQHHRPGRRSPPHAGRRPRPQDARGPAEHVSVRPDRHADQSGGQEHVLRLWCRRRREAAT